MAVIYMRPFRRSGNQCDCCSEPFIDTLYLCGNFIYEGRLVFSRPIGRWAACYSCRGLLEAGNTSELACRSERDVRLYRDLLAHIVPGQQWLVHQVARKTETATQKKPKRARSALLELFQ